MPSAFIDDGAAAIFGALPPGMTIVDGELVRNTGDAQRPSDAESIRV